MPLLKSKLTSKAQTTIPKPVRAALHLQEGDELQYEIEGSRVIVTKANRVAEPEDPFVTFTEWATKADCEAYGDL
jgi:antitoxin PrlF